MKSGRRLAGRFLAVPALTAALCGFLGGADVHAQTPGLVLSDNARIGLSEAVGNRRTQTRTVRLATRPTGTVTVAMAVADTTVATVTPASLRFDTLTWNQAQTVTFAAVDDDIDNAVGHAGAAWLRRLAHDARHLPAPAGEGTACRAA